MSETGQPFTAPEITEGQQLEARGRAVTLANGESITLRFGARGIRWLEREYGSLGKFEEAIDTGAAVSALWDAIYAGTLHLRLGADVDEVLERFDERKLLTEYLPAFKEAFEEAVPMEAQEKPGQPTPRMLNENFLGPNSNSFPEANSTLVKTNSGE